MDFTETWGWPQWTIVILLFIRFILDSAQHGEPKLETTGDKKGQPKRYNGFDALSRMLLWAFILVAGGFFA